MKRWKNGEKLTYFEINNDYKGEILRYLKIYDNINLKKHKFMSKGVLFEASIQEERKVSG